MRAVYKFCQDRSRPDGADLVNGVHQREPFDQPMRHDKLSPKRLLPIRKQRL
jgi:hypothetical protein